MNIKRIYAVILTMIMLFCALFSTVAFAERIGENVDGNKIGTGELKKNDIIDVRVLDKIDWIYDQMKVGTIPDTILPIYAEYFSGIVYNNGIIEVMTNDPSADFMQQLSEETGIVVKECDYSFNELTDSWLMLIAMAQSNKIDFCALGMDIRSNNLALDVVDSLSMGTNAIDSKTKAQKYDGVLKANGVEPEMIAIRTVAEGPKPTAVAQAGTAMNNYTRGSTSSFNVGVRYPQSPYYMLMQAHQTKVNDVIRNGSGQTIGTVIDKWFKYLMTTVTLPDGSKPLVTVHLDAAVVQLNSGNTVNNTLNISGTNVIRPSTYRSASVGLPVRMQGNVTKTPSSGNITAINQIYRFEEPRIGTGWFYYSGATANYSCAEGDSGGAVFYVTTSGPEWVGIQSAGTAGYPSYFATAQDIYMLTEYLPAS